MSAVKGLSASGPSDRSEDLSLRFVGRLAEPFL